MTDSIFERMSPQEVERVKSAGTAVRLPQGWSPIWERTPPDKAYILTKGEVSVRKGGQEIATLGPGQIMGEAAIVNHALRNASIVALTPLELIHYTSDQVKKLIEEVPAFRRALETAASERLGT